MPCGTHHLLYESRYEEVQIHKTNKCADLIEEIKEKDFITDVITLEVGSRAPFNPTGSDDLMAHIN